MELKDTVEMMNSTNYKERFKAEYHQLKERLERLEELNVKIEAAERSCGKVEIPQHDCPSSLLMEQQRYMSEYLHVLEVRAVIEGIEI